MKGRRGITNQQIKNALKATGGFVSHAAMRLGTSHQNISARVKRSPELTKFIEKLKDFNLDTAEIQLLNLIRSGDFQAIKFYLQCQGKDRGYIQLFKGEISGQVDHNVKIEKIERVIIDPNPIEEIPHKSAEPVLININNDD
jgi:hypothetical protein